MKTTGSLLTSTISLLALAGCHTQTAPQTDGASTAGGETQQGYVQMYDGEGNQMRRSTTRAEQPTYPPQDGTSAAAAPSSGASDGAMMQGQGGMMGQDHAMGQGSMMQGQDHTMGQGSMMQGQDHTMGQGSMMQGQDGMQGGPMAAACPMVGDGAQVREQDIEGGVALTFTSEDPAQVDTLRAHVQRMARMPGWSGQGRGPNALPPSDAFAVDVPNGARLELRARAPADVLALRDAARARTDRMRAGECPRMRASAGRAQPPA